MAVLSHCLLSIYIFPDKPGLLSTVLREISFCSGQHSVERWISKQCAENKRMSVQALIKWDGYAHPTTAKTQKTSVKRRMRERLRQPDDGKECYEMISSEHDMVIAIMNSYTHTRPSIQESEHRRGSRSLDLSSN